MPLYLVTSQASALEGEVTLCFQFPVVSFLFSETVVQRNQSLICSSLCLLHLPMADILPYLKLELGKTVAGGTLFIASC